jgi:hypothetical protein
MLQHNGRLANPIDPYVRELKKWTGKRKKTDEDHAAIMELEARASVYETDDGLLGLPTDNVWRCLYDAATAFKRGADLKRALIPDGLVAPIEIDGLTVGVDVFLKDSNHIDYRSVAVQRNRTMRARPIVPTGWQSIHTFDLLTDIVDEETLIPILERAGRVVGVGDFRPRFGTFLAEVVK